MSEMRGVQRVSFAFLALAVGSSLDAQIDRITGKNFATRSEVLATHGMVCTSIPTATQVGLDILKRDGSAVDAAIAANATLGLMEPVSNGIGGDLFAIIYSAKENKLYGINGSGRSPLGLSYDQMKAELAKLDRQTIPPLGMLPISVPGCVDAWAELHKKFGKLKLSDDLAPAIRYAEEGFPVTDLIAYYWAFGPRLYKGLPGAFLETYTLPVERAHPGADQPPDAERREMAGPIRGSALNARWNSVRSSSTARANRMRSSATSSVSSGGFGRSGYNVASPYAATTTGLEAFYWDKGVPPPVAQPLLLQPGFGAGFTAEKTVRVLPRCKC